MGSVEGKLNKKGVEYSFELYGCDIVVDEYFNPYILEINDNPGLSIYSPVRTTLIPRMIDDLFRLTIDRIFPPRYDEKYIVSGKYCSPFRVFDYPDEDVLFDFICKI